MSPSSSATDPLKVFYFVRGGFAFELKLPTDFEAIDYRTGGGGPFFGPREEIEDLQMQSRATRPLVKGVIEVNDLVRNPPEPVFDRAKDRFVFETMDLASSPIDVTIESKKRIDSSSVPILLIKSKVVSASETDRRTAWIYSAHLFLPDDSYFSIVFHTPQPPTRVNDEIWQYLATSLRVRSRLVIP